MTFKYQSRYGAAVACMAIVWAAIAVAQSSDEDASGLDSLVQLIGEVDDADVQFDLLQGIQEGLKGRKSIRMPSKWPDLYKKLARSDSEKVREKARTMALVFGDPLAIEATRKLAADKRLEPTKRRQALELLVQAKVDKLAPLLHELLGDREVRREALRGLASYDDPKTPALVLERYRVFTAEEKRDAVATLASRPAYAKALLDALERKTLPATDISAYIARQVHALGSPQISQRLTRLWGSIRRTSKDTEALIQKYKKTYSPKFIADGNVSLGRLTFKKTCQQCHTLFGEGAKIGPDLTGSNRANLDYVLHNVLDPSAAVGNAYKMTSIHTADGRVLSGIIQDETDQTLTVQTANDRITLDRADVDQLKPSPVSMMPEGIVQKLTKMQMRDLLLYLRSPKQVPLPQ